MLWIGFFLRLGIAWLLLSSGFYLAFTGDIENFHQTAREMLGLGAAVNPLIAEEFTIDDAYSYFISLIYMLTTDSMYLTSILSCLVWFFSGYFLIKIMDVLKLNLRRQKILFLIYILLPSSLLNTGVPLRESYELLAVNLSIYSSLQWYFQRNLKYLFVFFIGILLMGLMHIAMLVFGVILFIFTLILISFREDKSSYFFLLPTSLLVLIPIFGFNYISQYLDYFGGQGLEGAGAELADAVRLFQFGSIIDSGASRAQYAELQLEIDGISGLLFFLPTALFQYLFEPMPWRNLSLVDYVLVLENLMRAIFIFFGVKGLFVLPSNQKKIIFFLLACYLSTELIWAVGTTNRGTASRHHVPSLGILLLIGLAFQQYYKKMER
ncbi:MAG: hypothetical protein VYC46_01105 [Pseudomonadota bacterium]|nr:hypothetical protein [Pseudomonadota bacterium]